MSQLPDLIVRIADRRETPMPETDCMVEATLKRHGVDRGGAWSLSSVR
jgi:hypothetical protein